MWRENLSYGVGMTLTFFFPSWVPLALVPIKLADFAEHGHGVWSTASLAHATDIRQSIKPTPKAAESGVPRECILIFRLLFPVGLDKHTLDQSDTAPGPEAARYICTMYLYRYTTRLFDKADGKGECSVGL